MRIQLQERELTELFTQIYTSTLQDQYTSLFPYRYDPILGVGSLDGTGVSWITAQKYLTNEELTINWRDPNRFVGVTFGKNTSYALIDIDVDSQYHPHCQIIKVEDALAKVGIHQINWYKSSSSEGWHGYIPFNKEISSWTVAVVLTQALTTAGFEIAKGHLELFPNTKSWNSKYNSHRLPLQSGFEFTKNELNWFLLDWEEAANLNDATLFESYSEEARSWFKARKLINSNFNKSEFTAKGQKSTNWYNNLQATLKEGWTAKSQTNDILGDIAALHRVFTKASSVEELASMVIETSINLPGYQQFCNHQKEIVKRCTEWAKCAWKKYRPLGSLNQKTYVKKTEEKNKNLAKLKKIRAKISEALVNLRKFEVKITYRLLAKKAGVSINSISKHKDLLTKELTSLETAVIDSPNLEAVNSKKADKELSVLPHLIVKRYDTRFKVKTKPIRLKIKVKGLEVIYTNQLSLAKLMSTNILILKPLTNELIYQTSQYFEPTHESNYQLLNDSDWITECYEKLKQLSNLPANWDSYNAEPPNNIALNWTREILKILFKMGFPPTRITPSVENGVGISFICEHKYADIECFNEGDILAVISDGKGIPEVWEVESTTLAITSTIDKIREFLQR